MILSEVINVEENRWEKIKFLHIKGNCHIGVFQDRFSQLKQLILDSFIFDYSLNLPSRKNMHIQFINCQFHTNFSVEIKKEKQENIEMLMMNLTQCTYFNLNGYRYPYELGWQKIKTESRIDYFPCIYDFAGYHVIIYGEKKRAEILNTDKVNGLAEEKKLMYLLYYLKLCDFDIIFQSLNFNTAAVDFSSTEIRTVEFRNCTFGSDTTLQISSHQTLKFPDLHLLFKPIIKDGCITYHRIPKNKECHCVIL